MPTYRFQCKNCGLNFTARAEMGVRELPCAACHKGAVRELPKEIHTGHRVTGLGPTAAPPNTGFAGVDFNADRVIGEDARQKWAVIRQRQQHKVDQIRAAGATGFDLSRTPEGSYRLMAPKERTAKEQARASLHARLAQMQLQRVRSGGSGR